MCSVLGLSLTIPALTRGSSAGQPYSPAPASGWSAPGLWLSGPAVRTLWHAAHSPAAACPAAWSSTRRVGKGGTNLYNEVGTKISAWPPTTTRPIDFKIRAQWSRDEDHGAVGCLGLVGRWWITKGKLGGLWRGAQRHTQAMAKGSREMGGVVWSPGSLTSISCTCSSLVEYICCRDSSSSLFLSSRVFPSSAAKCKSGGREMGANRTG